MSIIKFKDYPNFKPNISPLKMFKLGSFGGTYWRPIYSSIIDKELKDIHKKKFTCKITKNKTSFIELWWSNLDEKLLL